MMEYFKGVFPGLSHQERRLNSNYGQTMGEIKVKSTPSGDFFVLYKFCLYANVVLQVRSLL